jgi:C4-dicarboxylate-specific signal transduction histidine kinase
MLASEITRLQKLVVEPSQALGPFTLADAVRAAVESADADGAEVSVDVQASPAVIGSPADTAEVVRELVAAAAAEGGTASQVLAVELTEEGEWGVMRLRFRSAGFPRHERRAILARRLSGVGSGPDDLGLHVAAQLVRDQGGELSLRAGENGELCFELRLPIKEAVV